MRKELLKGLTDEQLEAVAGGCSDVGDARKCPECGTDNAKLEKDYDTNSSLFFISRIS